MTFSTSSDPVINCLHDDDSNDDVYLSVYWNAGILGAASYNISTCELSLLPDMPQSTLFEFIAQLLHMTEPKQILFSVKSNDKLTKLLETLTFPNSEYKLLSLPHEKFAYDNAKQSLFSINLPEMPVNYTFSERVQYLSSKFPVDNQAMIRAAGALLRFVRTLPHWKEVKLQSDGLPVLSITTLVIDGFLVLDDNIFRSLQIFHKDLHPSSSKSRGSGSKEGLSIFGYLNKCRSRMGAKKLRTWLSRPSRDYNVINLRYDIIEFLSQNDSKDFVKSLISCLKNVRDLSGILGRMYKFEAKINDWPALYKCCYSVVEIKSLIENSSVAKNFPLFEDLSKLAGNEVQKLGLLIAKIVDFEEMMQQKRFIVKVGNDPDLDERKHLFNGLPDLMTVVAEDELEALDSNVISSCNIIYLQNFGFLLALSFNSLGYSDTSSTNVLTHTDDFPSLRFIFTSDNVVYFKSQRTLQLDEDFGDTLSEIIDREISIMHRLQDCILDSKELLLQLMDKISELDVLVAFALCVNEFNLSRPELTKDNVISIGEGRHLLQEVCTSTFVANDFKSGGVNSKIKFITGANASGKSVYVKQTALCVFMAQVGCFVPCKNAIIHPVDRFFTRISTYESVSVNLSTFAIDLNEVTKALNFATQDSLVLLDEFGKGTSVVDGISLLVSSLQYWLNKGFVACPHILVASHFMDIINLRLLPVNSPLISYHKMDVVEVNSELVPVYKLVDGVASESGFAQVAANSGVPMSIIERAKQVLKLTNEEQKVIPEQLSCLSELEKERLIAVQKFAQLDLDNCDIEKFFHDVVAPCE